MRVIFLDVDGVLNYHDLFMKQYSEWKKTGIRKTPIDEEKISLLKDIVDVMDASIVLSSCWRLHFDNNLNPLYKDAKDLVKLLEDYDMELYSKTGPCTSFRGKEIGDWLKEHKEVDDFIIIDDDSDMGEYSNKLIKTDFYKDGLTKEHVDIVRKRYSSKNKSKGGKK